MQFQFINNACSGYEVERQQLRHTQKPHLLCSLLLLTMFSIDTVSKVLVGKTISAHSSIEMSAKRNQRTDRLKMSREAGLVVRQRKEGSNGTKYGQKLWLLIKVKGYYFFNKGHRPGYC